VFVGRFGRVRPIAVGALLDSQIMQDMKRLEAQFPIGTPVRVTMTTNFRDRALTSHAFGTIEAWDRLPTGSWFAQGKNDKLWLDRVRLRKVDGEISLLVIDDATTIAKLEPAAA